MVKKSEMTLHSRYTEHKVVYNMAKRDKSKELGTIKEKKLLTEKGNARKLDCGHFGVAWMLSQGKTYCKDCAISGKRLIV